MSEQSTSESAAQKMKVADKKNTIYCQQEQFVLKRSARLNLDPGRGDGGDWGDGGDRGDRGDLDDR